MWENKFDAVVDPRPFSTWWSLTYTLSSAILPLKLRIILSDPFSNVSYLFVLYVYNACHRTNQNHRLNMGLTSHLSDSYDTFSSSCFSFSLVLSLMMTNLTNQMITDQGLGSLQVCAFWYVLNYLLIKSFDFRLVESSLIKYQYS